MKSPLDNLRGLIAITSVRNEVACAKVLTTVASVLIPVGRSRMYEVGSEIYTRRGRCDLVVFAEEHLNDAETKKVAYVWELKAPQCRAFELDGRDRARPTADLHSAENQLIQYTKSLRSDREWQTENAIVAEQDIRVGGIVIGRQDNPKATGPEKKEIRLARRAKEIREEFFYRGQLLLWDWDHVAWSVESLPVSRQTIAGNLGTTGQGAVLSAGGMAANLALKLTVGRRRPPAP